MNELEQICLAELYTAHARMVKAKAAYSMADEDYIDACDRVEDTLEAKEDAVNAYDEARTACYEAAKESMDIAIKELHKGK